MLGSVEIQNTGGAQHHKAMLRDAWESANVKCLNSFGFAI